MRSQSIKLHCMGKGRRETSTPAGCLAILFLLLLEACSPPHAASVRWRTWRASDIWRAASTAPLKRVAYGARACRRSATACACKRRPDGRLAPYVVEGVEQGVDVDALWRRRDTLPMARQAA